MCLIRHNDTLPREYSVIISVFFFNFCIFGNIFFADMVEIGMHTLKLFCLPSTIHAGEKTHKKQHAESREQMGFLALILHLKDKTTALWFHSAVKN